LQNQAISIRRLLASAVFLACTAAAVPASGAPATDQVSNTAALNFVGADIDSVIKAIGHYTNVNFIIDPRVKGTINLVSEKPLTKAQAFSLLTSALRMQGYAVVMGDGYAKVVPEADAKLQPGPTLAKGARIKGDQIATQIFRLNYESAANMVGVLRPLISPNNTINANPGTNSLVITDYADNLRRLGKIIAALDAPATSDLEVVPLNYGFATEIAVMVGRLMETGGAQAPGVADSGRTSLLADVRTNSIVIRAPSQARANMAKLLIQKLDQPTAQPGNIHVVYLRNADATKLAQTLRAVVAADTSTPQTTTPAQATPAAGATGTGTAGAATGQNVAPLSSGTAAPATLSSGGSAGFIQADASTNTLIITASEPIYRNLRAVIDKLDVRRAQVFIESLIVEVTADKAAEFGVQWLGLSGDSTSSYRIGGGTSFGTGGNNIGNLALGNGTVLPGNGISIGIFKQVGGKLGLGAVAHALETDANTNILSTPNLITLDNEEARIIVGQNVPFITGQYTTAASSGSTGVNPFQTVERKDVGLMLRVRPQISQGGTVRMAIYQETSAVDPTSLTNSAGIITSKRSIETNVLADDGQIVVLGGLIEDTVSDSTDKVPGLGNVPLLGNLFKYQNRSRKKTNLMVFLRPIVIRNSEQSASVVADRYDYIRGTEIAMQPPPTLVLPDTGAAILPPLQGGRPVGGTLVKSLAVASVPDSKIGNSMGNAVLPAAGGTLPPSLPIEGSTLLPTLPIEGSTLIPTIPASTPAPSTAP
jgi:general secretion pathway protein D